MQACLIFKFLKLQISSDDNSLIPVYIYFNGRFVAKFLDFVQNVFSNIEL